MTVVVLAATPAPKLLRAYRMTCYQAAGVTIRIGRRCRKIDRLLARHGVRTAVLVTAYNPFSQMMSPAWNHRMQQRLRDSLRRQKCLCGRGTLGRWSEAHLLVFGDPRPTQKLARRYRQNGIVIVHRGQPARLLIGF
jgi:hypothetical protein